jgi:hypothetical protein
MQINELPSKQGGQWVRDGLGYVKAQPLPMLSMTFLYLMCLIIPSMLPGLGYVAPLIVSPILTVGLVHCARAVDQKQMAKPSLLFAAFRDGEGKAWKPLLLMGIVNAVFTAIALMAASVIDDGTLWKLVTGALKSDDPALKDVGSLMLGFATFLFIYIPLQMTMWFSPMFVAWHKMGVLQALFSSFIAVLRNKKAFLRYGLSWFSLMVMISLIINVVGAITKSPMLVALVTLPLSTLAMAAIYSSFWPTYRDVFNEPTVVSAPTVPEV